MGDSGSLSLFIIFVEAFNASDIYDIGWMAARSWMIGISGVLIAIAIAIRSTEEHVNLLKGGQSGFIPMAINIMIIAFAIGLYFFIASLVIDLFNSIYSLLSSSPLVQLTTDLDNVWKKLLEKDYKFKISEIGDTIFSAFAFIAYWITHMILVLVTLAMRIAHALLTSFCLFWGAVALPMSITTGLKSLGAFKNIAMMVLIWPIVEGFFMYAIGGSFSTMLNSSALNVDSFTTWNMGTFVFYLSVFAIINLLLVAALISAPFVAQGLANNTGNVSGMIGSFAGAGIAAGVVAAKAMAPKSVQEAMSGKVSSSFGNVGKDSAMAGGGALKKGGLALAKGAYDVANMFKKPNYSNSVGVGFSSGSSGGAAASGSSMGDGGSIKVGAPKLGNGQTAKPSTGFSSSVGVGLSKGSPTAAMSATGGGSAGAHNSSPVVQAPRSDAKGGGQPARSNTTSQPGSQSTQRPTSSSMTNSSVAGGSANEPSIGQSSNSELRQPKVDPKIAVSDPKKKPFGEGLTKKLTQSGSDDARSSSEDTGDTATAPPSALSEAEQRKKRRDARAGQFVNKARKSKPKNPDKPKP